MMWLFCAAASPRTGFSLPQILQKPARIAHLAYDAFYRRIAQSRPRKILHAAAQYVSRAPAQCSNSPSLVVPTATVPHPPYLPANYRRPGSYFGLVPPREP